MIPVEHFYNTLLIKSGNVTTYFSIIPVLVAIWKWKKLNRPLKIFLLFLVIKVLLNFVMQIFIWATGKYFIFWKPLLERLKIENVLFINILFYLNAFLVLGFFFSLVLKISKHLYKYAISILCLSSILVYWFVDGYQGYGLVGPILQVVFVCNFAFIIIWIIVQNGSVVSLNKNPIFIICIGLFLSYFISIFFKFVAEKLYDTDFVLYCKFHIVRNILEVISQIFFALAFYRSGYAKYLINR